MEHKCENETKYGEYTEDGKYRNVVVCKYCGKKTYFYLPEFDKN